MKYYKHIGTYCNLGRIWFAVEDDVGVYVKYYYDNNYHNIGIESVIKTPSHPVYLGDKDWHNIDIEECTKDEWEKEIFLLGI
jgi:hypothetical protein